MLYCCFISFDMYLSVVCGENQCSSLLVSETSTPLKALSKLVAGEQQHANPSLAGKAVSRDLRSFCTYQKRVTCTVRHT
ncbi:hypothetical protein MHYP_G00063650 [Metynnis hypsauchen]